MWVSLREGEQKGVSSSVNFPVAMFGLAFERTNGLFKSRRESSTARQRYKQKNAGPEAEVPRKPLIFIFLPGSQISTAEP